MNNLAPPFFTHFNLSLNRKKTCVNKRHEKETKLISTSATNSLHIRTGNLDCCKCRHIGGYY